MVLDVINFSQHALQPDVLEAIRVNADAEVLQTTNVNLQIEESRPLAEQVAGAVDGLPWPSTELQSRTILLILPGLAPAAAALLAELHGRLGYFPSFARLRRGDSPIVAYELAEIVNLQSVRERARIKRAN